MKEDQNKKEENEKEENRPLTIVEYAAFKPETLDVEKRTIELVWTTGARVLRSSFFSGSFFRELEISNKAVRMERLNNGAPLLNTHQQWDLKDVIGVVEKASLKIKEKQGVATVRFSKREDVEPIFQDVKDGIIRNVSVGFFIHKEEKIEDSADGIPVYRATDWEPIEISLVPAGADDGAGTRSYNEKENQKINLKMEKTKMDEKEKKELEQKNEQRMKEATEKARLEAVESERKRSKEIREIGEKVKVDRNFIESLINDGKSVDEARAAIIDKLAVSDKTEVDNHPTNVQRGNLDETVTRRDAMAIALESRTSLKTELTEPAKEYRTFTMLELARRCLENAGEKVTFASKNEIVKRALHSTSDFPYLLANVANKSLRRAFQLYPKTFGPLVTTANIPDFKEVSRVNVSNFPSLEEVKEGAEYKKGTATESKEVYSLATYGKIIGFTRQMIINDDLSGIERIARSVGLKAGVVESDVVWGVLTANAAMGDGNNLFSTAHKNYVAAGGGAAPSETTLSAAEKAMMLQTGLDGVDVLNIMPKYLVGPVTLKTTILKLLSAIVAAQTSTVNVFAGKYEPIFEPRLDTASTTGWYLTSSTEQIDLIEVGYLDGVQDVYTEERLGFDIDGMEMKARFEVAAKALDWRGLYFNAGL